jgi:REP element-mobilizing transposase RayT
MAPPRIEIAGSFYHVNGKAVHGTSLFRDDVDRLAFLKLLEEEAAFSDWTLLAYSLMTTHHHALLRLNNETLSSGFRRLNSRYAKSYNLRHDRRGALWQRRFYDSMTENHAHLLETIRYISRNASRGNVVDAPEDWPWCSYGRYHRRRSKDSIVDEGEASRALRDESEVARARLRAFVEGLTPARRRGRRVSDRGHEREAKPRAAETAASCSRPFVATPPSSSARRRERRAPAARLLDEQLRPRSPTRAPRGRRRRRSPLGDEAVLPEVAVAAVRPRALDDRLPAGGHPAL